MHVKMKKEMMTLMVFMMVLIPVVSAGIGMKWQIENLTIFEGRETCLSYGIYNPWPEDSKVRIELSDMLQNVVYSSYSQERFIPRDTSSKESIPVTFCFNTPKIYPEDCLFLGLFCKQDCEMDEAIFSGEVNVVELSNISIKGADLSKTSIALSAPLNLKVKCEAHPRRYTPFYLLVAFIAFMLLTPKYLKRKKS